MTCETGLSLNGMNKNKGFASIVVIGIVVLILGLIGIALLKNAKSPTVVTPTPTPSAVDKSNWKTYRNERYGFEFKYPDTCRLDQEVIERDQDKIQIAKLINETDNYFDRFSITISIRKLDYKSIWSFKYNPQLFIPDQSEWTGFRYLKEINVGGKHGWEYYRSIYLYKANTAWITDIYVDIGNNNMLIFSMVGNENVRRDDNPNGTPGYGKYFDKILSTFKFFESITTP